MSQAAVPAGSAVVTDAHVQQAIGRYRAELIAAQQADGGWPHPGYPVGGTALVLLALKQAGVPNSDAAVQRAVRFLLNHRDGKVYSEGLVACALEQVDPRLQRPRIQEAVEFLVDAQNPAGNWGYGERHGGDNSNTQFAILGLAAGERCGLPLPEAVRRSAADHWLSQQHAAGGWGYGQCRKCPGCIQPTFSMTCAGVASLCLLGARFETPGDRCGRYEQNTEVAAGLHWLANALARPEAHLGRGHGLYSLYALERVAIFLDLKTIGGVDWYRLGAEAILRTAPTAMPDKAFALLFLAKAATPVALAKWRWAGDWNNDHADAMTWVGEAGKAMDQRLDWLPVSLDGEDQPAAKASLLFVNGHEPFVAKAPELAALRSFLAGGGTVVVEACCGSRAFAESVQAVLERKLFPERELRFLPPSTTHPVYAAFYPLTPRDLPLLQLRGSGCRRERVFLLGREISCALNGEKSQTERAAAVKLATNLLAFAIEQKQPQGKLDAAPRSRPDISGLAEDEVASRPASLAARRLNLPLGRLKHRGDCFCDSHFFSALQPLLAADPQLPLFDGEIAVDPASEAMFDVPVLFLTGHDDPGLDEPEALGLRAYLQQGGFLLVSACCSSRTFDRGFRELLARVAPNDALEVIPLTDAVFARPFPLAQHAALGTAAYNERWGGRWAELYGVRRDGRWIVVYSAIDFCCAFEDDLDDPKVPAYAKESAVPLVLNLLTAAVAP